MPVSLESVQPEMAETTETVETAETAETTETAETAETVEIDNSEAQEPAPVQPPLQLPLKKTDDIPAPKRRGRPPKSQSQSQSQTEPQTPKAKPAPKRVQRRAPPPLLESPSGSSGSSGESESQTAELNRDDMETMLLSYLVQRKTNRLTNAGQCGHNWPD